VAFTFTSVSDPGLRRDLQRFADGVATQTPVATFELVRVTFGTANQDVDIAHHLNPDNPESVHYVVVGQSAAGVVYQDNSATRKPWQQTHIFLRRSAVTDAIILLFLGATNVSFFP